MADEIARLQEQVAELAGAKPGDRTAEEVRPILEQLLEHLESGRLRAAVRTNDGQWIVQPWVKQGILLCFRHSETVDFSINSTFQYRDKALLPPQDLLARPDPPRIVPGGTTVRRGAHIGRHVVIMPPSYINVGGFVDDHTMIDSHVLVGSCAQVGRNVHLSAGVQIGGVLEPIGALPVIIEDDVFVGAQCGIFEGTTVRKGALLGAGVRLTRGTPLYDLVNEQVYRARADAPLVVPERAVVVPGARPARGNFARSHGLMLRTPIIVRYREEGETAAYAMESELR